MSQPFAQSQKEEQINNMAEKLRNRNASYETLSAYHTCWTQTVLYLQLRKMSL